MIVRGSLEQIKEDVKQRLQNYTYFALGTDDTAPTLDDTALKAEFFRKAVTEIKVAADTVLYRCYVSTTEANGYTIKEFGLFDSDAGGNMLLRQVIGGITKTEDMDIWFELEVGINVS